VLALVVALLSAVAFAAGTRWQRHSVSTAR
jgi:hypothetical protein